jgi:hypothetical protein
MVGVLRAIAVDGWIDREGASYGTSPGPVRGSNRVARSATRMGTAAELSPSTTIRLDAWSRAGDIIDRGRGPILDPAPTRTTKPGSDRSLWSSAAADG